MKWGKKKPPSPSSSQASSMPRAFPVSWFSKLKNMGMGSRLRPERVKPKGRRRNSPSRSPWQQASGSGDGRFYGGGDDGFWRLSFGEEDDGMRRREGSVPRSVLYESDDELELPFSSCRNCRSSFIKAGERGESRMLSNMVTDTRKMRELHEGIEITLGSGKCKGKEGRREPKRKTPRQETLKDQKIQKANRRVLKEKRSEFDGELDAAERSIESVEKHILEPKPATRIRTNGGDHNNLRTSDSRKHRHAASMNSRSSSLGTIEEDCCKFASLNLEETDAPSEEEKRKLKEMTIKELMSRSEKQRKSIHISRELQCRTKRRSKIKVHSPGTPTKGESCKIKALENMKAKMKVKKIKESIVEGRKQIESFAVVKCSFDPQKDFRDSMLEMILVKDISQPEELEELLACYLTLNSDEYHDLIIKVFRQVWFGLNPTNFDPELQVNIAMNDLTY